MDNPEYFGRNSGIVPKKGVVAYIVDNIVHVDYGCGETYGEYAHSDESLVHCLDPNNIMKDLV